jgi:DNA-binding NtrC family response regulator
MKKPNGVVLVVEDDSIIAFDTGATLEHALGVIVRRCPFNSAAVAEILTAEPPNMMLIDVCPWQTDRLEIVRYAVAAGIGVLIGTVCDEARHGIAGHEAIPVLVKPYNPLRLVGLARRILASHSRCRPNEQMPA